MQTIVKIDSRAVEVSETGGINEKLYALAFKDAIVRLQAIKRHAVLKSRATSALNKHAEFFFCIALT